MLVKYHLIVPADCTSDPHPIFYEGADRREQLKIMFDDIIRVCESDMIEGIRSVRATIGDIEYDSDHYSDWDGGEGDRKKAEGDMAEKHKTAGLYFYCDADDDKKHVPPGLTGVKEIAKLALKYPDKFDNISIGVIWTFAGQASCSDYIEINGEYSNENEVNFGSQDWWIDNEGYLPWCDEMEEFLGRYFPRAR